MNKFLKGAVAALGVLLMSATTFAVPANSDESQAAGLSMRVTQTEAGTGSSRVITWNVTITDTQGRDFITSGTPTSNQILFTRSSSRACVSVPVAFSANSLNSGSCNSYFSRLLNSDPARVSTSSGTITYDLKSTDGLGNDALASYDSVIASTRPYGAVVAYLRFSTDTGAGGDLRWNLYASTGNWTPTPVAGIVTVAGTGGSSPVSSTSDMDPGVSFAGPLVARLERSIVGGTGSVTIHGKRLFTVTSATVGGLDVTLTKTTRNGKFIVVSFENLPAGSHDLVLNSTGGKMTLRGAVTIK